METRLKCSSYFFAFRLRRLIRLNINCGFEYKNGYLSFGLKGLSCGFNIAYFDKISGDMFCKNQTLSPNCYSSQVSFAIMHLLLTSSCCHIA
jgi:hypothetical protein